MPGPPHMGPGRSVGAGGHGVYVGAGVPGGWVNHITIFDIGHWISIHIYITLSIYI